MEIYYNNLYHYRCFIICKQYFTLYFRLAPDLFDQYNGSIAIVGGRSVKLRVVESEAVLGDVEVGKNILTQTPTF